jgi:hypothetical protein
MQDYLIVSCSADSQLRIQHHTACHSDSNTYSQRLSLNPDEKEKLLRTYILQNPVSRQCKYLPVYLDPRDHDLHKHR